MKDKNEIKSYATSSEAKKAGWFSRRHATNWAHFEAQERRASRKERPPQKWVGGKIEDGGHWVHAAPDKSTTGHWAKKAKDARRVERANQRTK